MHVPKAPSQAGHMDYSKSTGTALNTHPGNVGGGEDSSFIPVDDKSPFAGYNWGLLYLYA